MAINPFSFNPGIQSQRVQPNSSPGSTPESNPVIQDGFQAAQPAAEVPAHQPVKLQVTPQQLISQSFQASLAALATAGVPVEVIMVTGHALTQDPLPTPGTNVPAPPAPLPQAVVQADPRLADTQQQIKQLESEIHHSDSQIRQISGQRWSQYVSDYGSVDHGVSPGDLAQAQGSLDMAVRDLRQAESKLNSLDLDEANRLIQSARNLSRQAESNARYVESREQSTFQSMLSRAESDASRRRYEREQCNSWSMGGGYGGGGYGNSGYGGSGFSSGGW